MADDVWRGMLAPLDVPTGDKRRFLSSGVTSRDLPLPLKWQRLDTEGHEDSVIVGSMNEINYGTVQQAIDGGWIDAKCIKKGMSADLMGAWGIGRFFQVNKDEMPRLAEDVAEAILLSQQGVVGPSVDPGSYEYVLARAGSDEPLSNEDLDEIMYEDPDVEIEIELLFTAYEIAAATLVSIPAFAECRPFEVISADSMVLTAAIRSDGWDSMPLAARDLEWDRTQADRNVSSWADLDSESPDWQRYASAFLYQDDQANPETKGAYGFQIADLIGDQLTIVPRAVFTVAGALQESRGGTNIPQADQDAMKGVVEKLYKRMADEFDDPNIVAPWVSETASISFAEDHVFNGALFTKPELSRITPITVTEDGHVFGHIATHDTCHVGMRDACTTAPVDDDGYRMFHRYQVLGVGQPVGRITAGHGQHQCSCRQCGGRNDDHACLKLSAGGAIAHHDQLSTVAWVCAGEDEDLNAIWVSGVINPEATIDDIGVLTRRKVSGDWRPIGNQTSLVEILALSREEPGFPLPRVRLSSPGIYALTAAGTVRPMVDGPSADPIDYERLATLVADKINTGMRTQPIGEPEPASPAVEVLADTSFEASVTETLAEVLSTVDGAITDLIMCELRGI
jgi:hypothetical protein